MNNLFKNLAIWLVIGIVLMTVFNQFNSRQAAQNTMDYSQFIEEVKAGRVTEVVMQGRKLTVTTVDNRKVIVQSPLMDLGLVGDLLNNRVKFKVMPEEE